MKKPRPARLRAATSTRSAAPARGSRRDRHAPPGLYRVLMEARAPAEFVGGLLSLMCHRSLPRGDGQPVLVFPGLAASDTSTLLLRRLLDALGYQSYGWAQGFNAGPRHGVVAGCRERIEELHGLHQRRVSLIGWSLGGLYARECAKLDRQRVRQVITLGSPFAGPPEGTNAYPLFQWLSGHRVDRTLIERLADAPPVPTSSIYSRTDGVVSWPLSVQQAGARTENIEIAASHFGMGFNPMVLYAIADRLAQPEGRWKPFQRDGLRRWFFPEPVAG